MDPGDPPSGVETVGAEREAAWHTLASLVAVGLAVVTPVLWFAAATDPLPLRGGLLAMMAAWIGAAAAAIALVTRYLSRRPWPWVLGLSAVILFVTFQWPVLTFFGDEIAAALGMSFLSALLPVAAAAALLFLAARLAGEAPFTAIIAVALVIPAAILGFIVVKLVTPTPEATAVAAGAGPDALVIVLDAYGRPDVLEELFAVDLAGFLADLEARGFAVPAAATANYPFTYAGVSSMLDLDYTLLPGEIEEEDRERVRGALKGATGLIPMFRNAGYETALIQNAWGGSNCGTVDWCIRDGQVAQSLWNVGRMTIFAPVVGQIWANPFNALSINHLTDLAGYATTPTADGRPRLMLAHLILPHVPLRLDEQCNRLPGGRLTEWGPQADLLETRRDGYRRQLACVNRLIVAALDEYLAVHPDAVVMITGDHGPGSTLNPNASWGEVSPATLRERIPVFSAYRLPRCDLQVRPDVTPVNGTRLLTDCALGSELGEIADRNIWVDLDGRGTAVDISGQFG